MEQIESAEHGFLRRKRYPEAVLLVCWYDPNGIPSIVETIAYMQRYSAYPVTVLNLYEHNYGDPPLKISPSLRLDAYRAVIIHNTVAYDVDNLRSLDQFLAIKLKDYEGVKILLKQDDHYKFRAIANFIGETFFDVIFTLTPLSEVNKIYDPAVTGGAQMEHMLAGYVTPSMRSRFNTREQRPIDIGYRGSIMPLSFGRLCYEKRKIGDDVKGLLSGRDLKLDISSRWEDRKGGEAWLSFLRSCKSVLGVESGSGLFDLDGELSNTCASIEKDLGSFSDSSAYAELYLDRLKHLEGNVKYFMISPRHFEAISAGTLQILFPGAYTNRMLAGRHYFELARDYSNLEEGVDLVLDEKRRSAFVEAAYEEVLLNKDNWIESFVARLDFLVGETLQRKGQNIKSIATSAFSKKNVVIIQAHEYGLDPRRDTWLEHGAPLEIAVHQVGISPKHALPGFFVSEAGGLIGALPRKQWAHGCLDSYLGQLGQSAAGSLVIRELYLLSHTMHLSNAEFSVFYGAPLDSPRVQIFREYLSYFLDTAVSLIDGVSNSSGAHALVAINLPALLPAILLKELLSTPIIYEALEYWPEADPDAAGFEIQFWSALERRVVKYADHCGTVSPGLAKLMARNYQHPFYFVPNCTLRGDAMASPPIAHARGAKTRFLFQGNFAPHRGLELLVKTWPSVNSDAVLLLRGPDNAYKNEMIELAKQLGVHDVSVFFPPPVAVPELICAARSDGDVAIIPYPPIGQNYKNCSPNKLSQYMAAGLPLLANDTAYVREIVTAAKAGLVVNFDSGDDVAKAVDTFVRNSELMRSSAENAHRYFLEVFNWEAQNVPIRDAMQSATSGANPELFQMYEYRAPYPFDIGAKRAIEPLPEVSASTMRFWRYLPLPLRNLMRPAAGWLRKTIYKLVLR